MWVEVLVVKLRVKVVKSGQEILMIQEMTPALYPPFARSLCTGHRHLPQKFMAPKKNFFSAVTVYPPM